MNLKHLIRSVLFAVHIDVTRGMQYDRQTMSIMRRCVRPGSSCVDVGAHTGDILDAMLRLAPHGTHYAFEPIPDFAAVLASRFAGKPVNIHAVALSSARGTSTFHVVENALAYSGLKKRRYDGKDVTVREITVATDRLDSFIPAAAKIDFIKIDVEGGEFDVMTGGVETIRRSRPVIVFECGIGGSDFYGTTAASMYELVTHTLDLHLSTMRRWLHGEPPLSADEFAALFATGSEYYFMAYPGEKGSPR